MSFQVILAVGEVVVCDCTCAYIEARVMMHLVSLLVYDLVYLREDPVYNVVASLFHFVNH